jgi:phosphoglycolate phosphatase
LSYKLLVFDWDGTLMDSEARIVACMQAALVESALTLPTVDAVRDIIGLGLREAVRILVPGAEEGLVEQIFDGYRRHFFSDRVPDSTLFPGVEETLERLDRAGYLMAVATGKGRRGLDKVLDETRLGRYFVATRCADETYSKPHPEMLNQLIDYAGVSAAETVMIGDTEYDLQMALNSGTASIAVCYGVHAPERLRRFSPLACLQSIAELPACLGPFTPIGAV